VAALAGALALGSLLGFTAIILLWLQAEDALQALRRESQQKEEQRKKAQRSRYEKQFTLAREAWATNNVDLARQLLEDCDPVHGRPPS